MVKITVTLMDGGKRVLTSDDAGFAQFLDSMRSDKAMFFEIAKESGGFHYIPKAIVLDIDVEDLGA